MIGSFHEGGSERQAVSLVRALRKDGTYDVSAATLNKQGVLLAETEDLLLDDIPEFPLTSFYNYGFIRQVRAFARFLNRNRIDLIHTHDFYTNIFGMAAASLARTGAKVASKRETLGLRSRPQETVEKIAFRLADAIVANSEAVRDHLIRLSVAESKINVIYNGVDVARFDKNGSDGASFRQKAGLGTDVRLITLVANLRHPVKDVPMFLRAARQVAASAEDVHFVIAGEGELETGLKAMAGKLGIGDSTHFLGRCADVPALLAASYACVLTSAAEGFSNSIIEYMAAGKPVAATRVGGASEAIVEGKTGYLVEAGDDATLAMSLITLLAEKSRAESMGTHGRIRAVECFSTAAQLTNTLELYGRCLAK